MKTFTFCKDDFETVIEKIRIFVRCLGGEKNAKYDIVIKKHKEKRSKSANAYFWTLLDKLASKVDVPKERIYKSYVKNIGGNNTIITAKAEAVNELCALWERNGAGWTSEVLENTADGKTSVILYYGSSTYNTKQMSDLINLCVEDCKALGIETLPPDELKKLLIMEANK